MATLGLAPDLVISNACVRTMDGRSRVDSAVAVKDGRILGVGQDEDILALAGRETARLDAGGRTVLPGFIDGHTHFHKSAVARNLLLNFNGPARHPKDITDMLNRVDERAGITPVGEWIKADGLNPFRLAEKRYPTRAELDGVAPDHPVVLVTRGNHNIAANSMALSLAGIDRRTEDPAGGRIERDEDGEPTGVLIETGKLRLDDHHPDNVVPRFGVDDRLAPVAETIGAFHAAGVTSIHDIVTDPVEIATWIRLRQTGDLNLRVQMLIRGVETQTPLEHLLGLGLEHGLGDAWLRHGGVKISVDGAYRGAAVYDAHPGEPDNFGLDRVPQDELDAAVTAAHRAGMRLAIHVVGPRATDMAMDAFEKALDGTPRPEMRHRLEHLILPHKRSQLERMAGLGLIGSIQPTFIWSLGDQWHDLWEDEKQRVGLLPYRDLRDLGIRLMGGTDFNGDIHGPFVGMKAAMTRTTPAGTVLDATQTLPLEDALRLQTTWAAYGGFEENLKGSLEEGKLADMVVVSADPYSVEPSALDTIEVDATFVDGALVFEREDRGWLGETAINNERRHASPDRRTHGS